MEIESLKRELEAARSRASERDVAAAELATFSVVIGELRSERKHWRDQAERLSLALSTPPEPSRLSWLGLRFGRRRIKPSDSPDQKARSAREAAQDAGLLHSVTGTPPPIEEFRPISVGPAQATTSILDKEGPPLTASDLEKALERLNKEIDDAQPARVPVAA